MLGHFVYNASITFPKSQTDRKQGRPTRLNTAPLLPRPGPLFVCRKEFMGIEGLTLQGLWANCFHVLLLFKRNNFNNGLIRSKSEK